MACLGKQFKIMDNLSGHKHDLRNNDQIDSRLQVLNHASHSEMTFFIRLNPFHLDAVERGILLQDEVNGIEFAACAQDVWFPWKSIEDGAKSLPGRGFRHNTIRTRSTDQVCNSAAKCFLRSEEHTSELQSRENLVCR